MAEKDDSFCERDIDELFKKLDSQIKIPDVPEVETIFVRAESEKSNLRSFRKTRYVAAAAAVVLICVSIPFIASGAKLGFAKSSDSTNGMIMKSADQAGFEANGYIAENESEEAYDVEDSYYSTANEEALSDDGEMDEYSESCSLVIDAALSDYFSNLSSDSSSSLENNKQLANSFTDNISKKRSVDIEMGDDSVSIMLYDTSGSVEIVTAFWVEGEFLSSSTDSGYYVINVAKKVTQEEFESGDYMPYIGDAQKGVYALSCSDIYVNEKITKAEINMSIKMNIEDGTYEIYASLE